MAPRTPGTDSASPSSSDRDLKDQEYHLKDTELSNSPTTTSHGFKVSRAGGGDTAMALFNDPNDVHEPYDEAEEKRLVRKIDWMILPYLAVCYAFL